jgi:hypothetical protein
VLHQTLPEPLLGRRTCHLDVGRVDGVDGAEVGVDLDDLVRRSAGPLQAGGVPLDDHLEGGRVDRSAVLAPAELAGAHEVAQRALRPELHRNGRRLGAENES